MNRKLQLFKYLIVDFLSAIVAWSLFLYFRLAPVQAEIHGITIMVGIGEDYLSTFMLVPFFWLFLYYISGYYNDVFRKSRLSELGQTLGVCFIGTLILIFFLYLGHREILNESDSISAYLNLLLLQFIFTYLPRLIITTLTTHRVHRGEIGFSTLLIGSNKKALDTYHEISQQKRSSGNKFIGFINVNRHTLNKMDHLLPHLGDVEKIREIIYERKIDEVIIAIETSEHDMINKIINKLIDTNVVIKVIPSMYDILTGRVRMNSILGTPLISISHDLMPAWQENIKTILDYCIATSALIVSLPIIVFLAIGIKLTSKGPVFYSHERIGRYGRPFNIYKFRSMYKGAEKDFPELSSKNDARTTPIGRFMRKARLDEIPNFVNILKGDMSLVGPRPERKYFIDQITRQAPHYLYLLKVKPGITSWGQVKYGYAENVEQMIQRLKYDLIYLDNMSLYVDFKIIIYTILTILRREGI